MESEGDSSAMRSEQIFCIGEIRPLNNSEAACVSICNYRLREKVIKDAIKPFANIRVGLPSEVVMNRIVVTVHAYSVEMVH